MGRNFKLFRSLEAERLDRKLALTFGFMSFIPILLLVWAMVYKVDLGLAIYLIVASAFIGYFVVARRMIRAVLTITQQVKAFSADRIEPRPDEEGEHDEIGELARAFNRITHELEHKIDALESSRQLVKRLLSRIGSAIVSYEGIDNILTLIVENTVAALEATLGSLLLVDGEKQELTVKAMATKNGHVVEAGQRIPLGEGLAGWVAKESRGMRSTGTSAALGCSTPNDQTGSLLCVPLMLRDQPIGVIGVLRENPARPFTEDDETLLASIASQMAVAIQNYRLNLDVERTYLETMRALALAVEAKDPYSAGHSKRVGAYAMKIGEQLGLDEEQLRTLNDAGILHDIGKIGIKDDILLKPGLLTTDEERIMQQHPLIGEAIVRPVRLLQKVVPLVRHHHEHFDGSGYPSGLKGEDIPLGARIVAVADSYDSMITDRPYRKRLAFEQVTAELRKTAGTQHDPVVVEAFLRILDDREQRLQLARSSESSTAPDPRD